MRDRACCEFGVVAPCEIFATFDLFPDPFGVGFVECDGRAGEFGVEAQRVKGMGTFARRLCLNLASQRFYAGYCERVDDRDVSIAAGQLLPLPELAA